MLAWARERGVSQERKCLQKIRGRGIWDVQMHQWADNTVMVGKLELSGCSFYFLVTTCGILILWPGIKPMPLAVEVSNVNNWTTREVTWMVQLVLSVWTSDYAICEKGKFPWSGVLINMPQLSICWAWIWAWQIGRSDFVHLSLVKLAWNKVFIFFTKAQRQGRMIFIQWEFEYIITFS